MMSMMMVELDTCSSCMSSRQRPAACPPTPCPKCEPREYWQAIDVTVEKGGPRVDLMLYGPPFDRLQQEYTLADNDGRFYRFRAPHVMSAAMRDAHEKLVTELQKLREENRDLLAENARMQKRLK